MDPDIELLARWRDGDTGAGNQLFQRHFDSICRFFENKIQGDIDELVQTTFLACVRSRDQFRMQSSFRTYLFTIARHELYGYLRRRRRDGAALDFSVTSLADLGPSPTSEIARNQDHELLLRGLRTLPVEQQILLELHYWEDMTLVELAEVFDIAQPTARTRLFRARKALRQRMEELAAEPAPNHATIESLDAWARSLRAQWHDSRHDD